MTFFRNKFNEEFLYLCNEQTPKGGSVSLGDEDPLFFMVGKNNNENQTDTVTVVPLLLFNKIEIENGEGKVVEDYIALCQENNDIIVTASYDSAYYRSGSSDYNCNLNVKEVTGDLDGG